MIRGWVLQLSRWADWAAALLVFAVAVRFAAGAVVLVMNERLSSPEAEVTGVGTTKVSSDPNVLLGPRAGLSSASERMKVLDGLVEKLPGSDEKAPQDPVLKVQLVVALGRDRSEVMVNGTSVGHTPFIGDIGCKQGEPVKIDVIPPKGMPWTFERRCLPEVIRVLHHQNGR